MVFARSIPQHTIILKLQWAEQQAMQYNPSVQAARQQFRIIEDQIPQAISPQDPTLMVDQQNELNSPLNWNSGSNQMWMVSEHFHFPGESFAQQHVLDIREKQMREILQLTRDQVILRTRIAFWNFYLIQRLWRIWIKVRPILNSLNLQLQSTVLKGQAVNFKNIQAQLELVQMANRYFHIQEKFKSTQIQLSAQLNLPYSTSYRLNYKIPMKRLDRSFSQEIQAALKQSPLLQIAKDQIREENSKKTVEWLKHFPNFSVRVYGVRNISNTGFQNFGVRVGMSLPIFFLLHQDWQSRAIEAQWRMAQAQLQKTKNTLMTQLAMDWERFQSANRLFKFYESGHFRTQVHEAWQASWIAYQNDQLPLKKLIQNFRTYLKMLTLYYQAKVRLEKLWAQVEYDTGNS
jgi:outer membrane protein TolC